MKGDNKAGATANELCRGANLRHSRRRHTLRPPWGHTATYLYRRWPIFISGPAERIVFRSDLRREEGKRTRCDSGMIELLLAHFREIREHVGYAADRLNVNVITHSITTDCRLSHNENST